MVTTASLRATAQLTRTAVAPCITARGVPQGGRWYSDEAPVPGDEAAVVSPKIRGIVDEISQLTLLEVADLCATLKARTLRSCTRWIVYWKYEL